MSNVYKLDGLPSDLLTSDKLNIRRLKVEATQSTVPQSENITNKVFTYNPDDTVNTITTTNKETGQALIKTFSYANGLVTGIDETIA